MKEYKRFLEKTGGKEDREREKLRYLSKLDEKTLLNLISHYEQLMASEINIIEDDYLGKMEQVAKLISEKEKKNWESNQDVSPRPQMSSLKSFLFFSLFECFSLFLPSIIEFLYHNLVCN